MEGWQIRPLADVCEIKPKKAVVRARFADDDVVSFAPMDVLGIDTKFMVPTATRPMAEVIGTYTYFAEGDVLVAKITPCFENGKLGIAKNLVNGVGFGSSEFIVLRPEPTLDREFLYYYLYRPDFREFGARTMTGAVGHKRVAADFIERLPIPIPPLPEQRRIVAILDEAFDAIATAKANTEKNLRNVREMRRSEAKALFDDGARSWPTRKLPDLSQNLDSRRIPITKSDRRPGDYPYYGASGIVDYVENYIFSEKALLISEDGANLLARSTPIAFPVAGKYWVNNHAHILKFHDQRTQNFVELYLESIPLNPYITGAAQPKLNQKALNSIPIPIPESLDEQERVVRRIAELGEAVEMLTDLGQRKVQALDELKQSLLHQAFTGQLTAKATDQQLEAVA